MEKKIVYGIFQKKKKNREETIKLSYADNFFLCPHQKQKQLIMHLMRIFLKGWISHYHDTNKENKKRWLLFWFGFGKVSFIL